MYAIDDCNQLTRTFWGFSAQCLSKLFLKEFTVLLVTTSFGRVFQVVVMISEKCLATDVLKCFTISFSPLFLVLSLRHNRRASCTGSSESIQVFKHMHTLVILAVSLYTADEIKVLDSLVVAVVSDFRNHH